MAGTTRFRHRARLRAERGQIVRTGVHELLALDFESGGLASEVVPILPDRSSRIGRLLRASFMRLAMVAIALQSTVQATISSFQFWSL